MACIVSPAQGNAIMYLSVNQTGVGDSQHVLDRGPVRTSALLRILSKTAGSCNISILGSMDVSLDPTSFFDVPWMLSTDPTFLKVEPLVYSVVGTQFYILQGDWPWRFLKLRYNSNTMSIDARISF
jgi:hypothetical protein